MSPIKIKKRSSILKKRRSSFESPESSTTTSTLRLPKRGIFFSDKNKVREFIQCDEKTTIWGNSYETSIAKSDRSGDGSNQSKKLSFDSTSSNFQTTSVSSETFESEKENFIIPHSNDTSQIDYKSLSPVYSSRNSSSCLSLDNLTVDILADEKKRIKQYNTENLNVTNILHLNGGTLTAKDGERLVLSPRKTIFFHENAKFSVSLQEKVLLKQSEAPSSNILVNCSDSIKLEDDEVEALNQQRKAIVSNDGMNLYLEGHDNSLNSFSYHLRRKKPSTNVENVPKVFKGEVKASVKKPKIFKLPEIPKVFKPKLNYLTNESDMNLDSPPIKPPNLQNQKQVVDDFMEFMVTDTPTKNLCHQMCSSKKHNITPLNNPPPKVIFSSSKSNWNRHTSFIPTPTKSRYSSDILKSLGLNLASPVSKNETLGKEKSPMEIDFNRKEISSKTQQKVQEIDETLLSDHAKMSRETIFGNDISIIETSADPELLKNARKTLFGGDIDETLSQENIAELKNTFFDLSIDETFTGTMSMTLMKLKDLADVVKTEDEPENRQTVFNHDISYSSNYDEFAGQKSNLMINCSSNNDTGTSLETTKELNAKAARLLRDPMGTTASTSNLFLKTFQNEVGIDIDMSLFENDSLKENSVVQKSKSAVAPDRKTIFDTNMSLHEEHEELMGDSLQVSKKQNSNPVNRETIYDLGIDISGIEPTLEIPQKLRCSDYGLIMVEETPPQASYKLTKKQSRKTILDVNTEMESLQRTETSITKTLQPSSRFTTYRNESMNETNVSEALRISEVLEKKGRVTTFKNYSMEETQEVAQNLVLMSSNRGTIYSNESINETMMNETTDAIQVCRKMERVTIYEDEMIDEQLKTQAAPTSRNDHRKTCYENTQVDETFKDLEIPEARDVQFHQPMLQYVANRTLEASGPFEVSCQTYPALSNQSLSPSTALHSREIQFLSELSLHLDELEILEDTTNLFRESVIVRNTNCVEEPCDRSTEPQGRQTTYEKVTMELDEVTEKLSKMPIEPILTYTIKKDDSKKLMNITDAEIISFLGDESNPCVNESFTNESQMQLSFGENISTYQNALQEFVNLTLKNSPLSTPVMNQTPHVPFKARNREIKSPINFAAKFDALIETLEETAESKPRLEIDEFLEKLNIEPVKIKFHPEMQSDYFETRMVNFKVKLAHEKAERKALIASQLPAIPPYDVLIRNKIECLNEEIDLEMKANLMIVRPIFPEHREFEFLLANKFETDDELKKFWELDLQFFFLNNFKLCHKMMEPFKLNIHLQELSGNINDSTIPIYFDQILMYKHPSYRGVLSTRHEFLKNEFRRAVGTDNFISRCSSMSHLFSFMEYYHNQVVHANLVVNNFLSIVNKHKAVLELNYLNVPYIFKRHLSEDGLDIVDLKIIVNESIENVSVVDISIKAWTSYVYLLQPRPNIADLKGLMLIEVVLYDIEKFLQDNTQRRPIE